MHQDERHPTQDSATIRPLTPTLDNFFRNLRTLGPEEIAERDKKEKFLERTRLVRAVELDIGRRYDYQRSSLESFVVYHPAQEEVLRQLRNVDIPGMISDGGGLLFFGPVGTGKDHLLVAMLYRAAGLHGIPCRWINGQDWFGTVRDRIDLGVSEDEILRDLNRPQVLAISDPIPPRRDPSAWNVEMMYRLVDRRYRNMRSTWVTMNVRSPEEADARLSSPVFDRLREQAHLVKCFWPSYRERPR